MTVILSAQGQELAGRVGIGGNCSVDNDNTIKISVDDADIRNHNKWLTYLESLKTRKDPFPYVCSISGVTADMLNNVWLLGGKTSQVDADNNIPHTLTVCDMAQTVDYPRIYHAVHDMLRQLRLWIDGNKDSLLLYIDDAETQWSKMLAEDRDAYDFSDSDSLSFNIVKYYESRSRKEIPALANANSILNEYVGMVALWNHIVSLPRSSTKIRLHPADSAGIYAGVTVIVPMTTKQETDIKIDVSLSVSGQSGDNFKLWLRTPKAAITPNKNTDISVKINNIDINIDNGSSDSSDSSNSSNSSDSSDTDINEGIEVAGTSSDVSVIAHIPEDEICSNQVLQFVVEAIPFYACPDAGDTYKESRKNERYSMSGENTWTVSVKVSKDNYIIQEMEYTKKSPYASVCSDISDS